MKLSRRGKLARRRKHTKRAGKHLRYKSKSKKFRGSKRYHRGNKRTYKRGKRFHRGGEDFEIKFDPSTFDLRYNKHYFTPDTSRFAVTGKIKTNGGIEIRFERYNKKGHIDKTFVIKDISMLTSGDKLETWESNDGSKYNFNYSENKPIIATIEAKAVIAKLDADEAKLPEKRDLANKLIEYVTNNGSDKERDSISKIRLVDSDPITIWNRFFANYYTTTNKDVPYPQLTDVKAEKWLDGKLQSLPSLSN